MDKITKNCVHCNKEFSANICDHIRGYGKYCGSDCQHAYLGILSKERKRGKERAYAITPSLCAQCNSTLPYKKKNNKYCSRKCSYNANQTDLVEAAHSWCASERRRASAQVAADKFIDTVTKPKYERSPKLCCVCQGPIAYKRRHSVTCTNVCTKELASTNAKNNPNCGGSTKQRIPYNGITLDSKWEVTVAISLDENNIRWERPNYFRISDGRKYTPDFYLPEYDVYLDPKSPRPWHKDRYDSQIAKITMFEEEYNVRCLILNKYQLNWGDIRTLILTESL